MRWIRSVFGQGQCASCFGVGWLEIRIKESESKLGSKEMINECCNLIYLNMNILIV